MVEKTVNYLLFLDSLNSVVGPLWASRFLDCHPEYFKRKQKLLAVERKNTHNLKDIEQYFESFRKLVEWFSLARKDIWNRDKTGFKISYSKA